MRKKLFTVALSAIMVIAMAVPAFAAVQPRDTPADAVQMNLTGTSYYMNAATESSATVNTRVTIWIQTTSATQKFYTNAGRLQNATNSSLAVGIVNSNSTAKFFATNSPDSIVKITGTRSGNQTTFRLFETGRIFGVYGLEKGNELYFANDVKYTTWTY